MKKGEAVSSSEAKDHALVFVVYLACPTLHPVSCYVPARQYTHTISSLPQSILELHPQVTNLDDAGEESWS